MIDLAALVLAETGAVGRARQAAEHRGGIDDEIMLVLVEPVGGQHLDRVPQRIAGLDIAGYDRQIGIGDQFRHAVEQAGQG